MPRTVKEILAQADELAKKFQNFEPEAASSRDGRPLRDVREAFEDLALAQKRLAERVTVAKAAGHSWAVIGSMIGTSGEAARQRYGTSEPRRKALAKSSRAIKASPTSGKARKTAAVSGKVVKTKSSVGATAKRPRTGSAGA